ncbi:hypothetical protein HHE06_14630 [Helicobacter heilmannii]|nr:hypothetical protein HHE014_02780 [Helicobacter heilmannii]CRF49372.1 hypothetical protein HHE03_09820 [Helicobacter heilmannii]CRF51576.1 hypothetical protein HHE06_14630 [Helicobacter heilmannii]
MDLGQAESERRWGFAGLVLASKPPQTQGINPETQAVAQLSRPCRLMALILA